MAADGLLASDIARDQVLALQPLDRDLLERCLGHKPRAWEDFVDRYMGLVIHVANHTAAARSIRLTPEDREDLCAEVFLAIIKDEFAVLSRFRGQSSLATYLAVVARRVVVRSLLERKGPRMAANEANGQGNVGAGMAGSGSAPGNGHSVSLDSAVSVSDLAEQRVEDRDEIERLLEELESSEAEIVRLFHLDGKSYREISQATGAPENTIGPTLSRARQKMRKADAHRA